MAKGFGAAQKIGSILKLIPNLKTYALLKEQSKQLNTQLIEELSFPEISQLVEEFKPQR
jgi:hypothetical protein